MTKIEIKNLSILFGPEKMRAKRMLVAGKSKQNILKETGCTVAVRNANLKIEEGELFVIMGLSGSGKSTLLRCINRLNEPSLGEVFINGKNITTSSDKELLDIRRKEMAMVFQHFGLLPHRTVLSNIAFGLELQGVPKKERDIEVHKIMSKTKTLDVSERLIKHLSKGYKQRVGLAGAMIGNPDILILDEPTVGLDPSQIIEMRELIRELSKNHTVLLSSHIMQEISAVCDEIIIINEGKMITKDTPENITKKMVDTNGVHIIVKGDKTKLKEALRTVSGIKNVSYDNEKDNENDNEKETIGLTIYCAEDEDIRVELFYALAKAECPVIELNKLDTSLEDAFLALTRGGSKQYGGRKLKKLKSGHKNEKENLSEGDIEQQDINNDEQSNFEKTDEERQVKTEENSDVRGGEE